MEASCQASSYLLKCISFVSPSLVLSLTFLSTAHRTQTREVSPTDQRIWLMYGILCLD